MVMKVSPSVLLLDFNIIIMMKSRSDYRKAITGTHLFPHIPASQLFIIFIGFFKNNNIFHYVKWNFTLYLHR
ncbi:hypothetical protein BM451_15730 [Dickeya dadantii]|nr:hypothetical protein BM451_15730 [Dickeya dadantii]